MSAPFQDERVAVEREDGAASPLVPFFSARFLSIVALQMQSVAVGWDVFDRTHRPIDLGFVGLAQFVPAALLSLVAGSVADHLDRRRIVITCYTAIGALAAGLFAMPRAWGVAPIYGLLVLLGVARAFGAPATQSLLPELVTKERFPKAVAQSSSVWQVALIVGPALGGVAYGAIGRGVYAGCSVLAVLAAVLMAFVRVRAARREKRAPNWSTVLAGVRYVREHRIVLGAISLDLFAVLLGGAVALLPVFARDVLHAGPWGLGLLRTAPALGASVTGLALARWPLARHAGLVMFACVALFGVATVVFGVSASLPLSLAALVVVGASDMVSVVVRSTLVQLETPDEMRGRVSAVNSLFIGASNELGELESGLTAEWLGAVPAVVVGGVGTLLVVAIWAWAFPSLRQVDRLQEATK